MTPSASARVGEIMDRNHAETCAEVYFRVALWIRGLPKEPRAPEVMLRFGVSKATAYRWLAAFRAARGVA